MTIDMNAIEALICYHGPKLMNQPCRDEDEPASPARRQTTRKGWRVVDDDMRAKILAMYKAGIGTTEIAANFRINESTVRDQARKSGVKRSKEQTKALRTSALHGVSKVKTGLYSTKRIKH